MGTACTMPSPELSMATSSCHRFAAHIDNVRTIMYFLKNYRLQTLGSIYSGAVVHIEPCSCQVNVTLPRLPITLFCTQSLIYCTNPFITLGATACTYFINFHKVLDSKALLCTCHPSLFTPMLWLYIYVLMHHKLHLVQPFQSTPLYTL